MMNLSSLSRASLAGGAAAALTLASLALQGVGLTWPALGATALAALAAGLVVVFSRQTRGSVDEAIALCDAICHGDFERRITIVRARGELGELHHRLNAMIDLTDAYVRETTAAMSAMRNHKYFRHILPGGLDGSFLAGADIINEAMSEVQARIGNVSSATGSFEQAIDAVVEIINRSADRMKTLAGSAETVAEETSSKSTAVAAAAEEATTNLQSVAESATRLAQSSSQIEEKVAESATIARRAVDHVHETGKTISSLNDATTEIGQVLQLIDEIAEQTNLLALNATIEAARAGEAGRGFAVVASEVKALAGQTARATSQISTHIENVQLATRKTVEAMAVIGETIESIGALTGDVVMTIAGQNQATAEIAGNVEQAYAGASEVTVNIHGVTEHSRETRVIAGDVLETSSLLADNAVLLAEKVRAYLLSLRHGPLDRRLGDDPTYSGPERRGEGEDDEMPREIRAA